MSNPTNTRRPTSHIAPFGVRMQPDLKAKLESAATASGRSLNAEIVDRLDRSFAVTSQGNTPEADSSRQTAMVELLTLVRRLDVVDLLELLQEITPAIPDEVVESKPELKANLKHLRGLVRRLRIAPDDAHRLAYEHQEKLKVVYGADQDKLNELFNLKPIAPLKPKPKP